MSAHRKRTVVSQQLRKNARVARNRNNPSAADDAKAILNTIGSLTALNGARWSGED